MQLPSAPINSNNNFPVVNPGLPANNGNYRDLRVFQENSGNQASPKTNIPPKSHEYGFLPNDQAQNIPGNSGLKYSN